MTKVSVIIPVYNAEKYLRKCLDSVLGQSLKEIEVICVDDGSTDSSAEILKEYAQRDERLTYHRNEKNIYAGPCRNKGLSAASGEYVLFLDGDDWISSGSLEQIYISAKKHRADVLRCRAIDYDNRSGNISVSLHNGLKRVPFFLWDKTMSFDKLWWLLPKLNVAPWGGISRRDFLIENNILFNDLRCVNDRSFYWESAIKAKRIVFSREQLVFYRTHISESLVGNRIKNFDCHFHSYALVNEHTRCLPVRMKKAVLNAELLDIANWLEQAAKTQYGREVTTKAKRFIQSMDSTPWHGKIEGTRWYSRMRSII